MKNSFIPIQLSIIIVNWNTKNLLYGCLKSIFEKISGLSYEVIVVDNASSDGSVEMIHQRFPQVRLIENRHNFGFAKANNQAIQLIRNSKYVLFLNSDVVIKKNAVQKLIIFLEKYSEAGIVGPALRLPDGKLQKGGVGGYFPSLLTAFNYFFFLSIFFPKIFKGIYIQQDAFKKSEKEVDLDWIAGTCLMTRFEIINSVGGLDESIFMYTEDMEWSERVKKAGWRNFYLSSAEVIHYLWGSQKKVSGKGINALIQYISRKHGICASIAFRFIAFAGLGMRFLFYVLLFLFGGGQRYREKSRQMFAFALSTLK